MSNIENAEGNQLVIDETNNIEFDKSLTFYINLTNYQNIDYVNDNGLILVSNNLTDEIVGLIVGDNVNENDILNELAYNLVEGRNLFYGPTVDYDIIKLQNLFTNENVRKSLTISVTWYEFKVTNTTIKEFVRETLLETSPTYPLLLVVAEPGAEEEESGESTEEDESSQNIEKVLKGVKEKNQKALVAETTKSLKEIKAKDEKVAANLKLFNGKINEKTGYLELTVKGTTTTDPESGSITVLSNETAFKALKNLLASSGFEIKNSREENLSVSPFNRSFKQTYYFQVSKSKTRYRAQLAESSLEALMAFDKICSMLLTEPYLYCENAEEAKEELNKVQKALSKNVLPVFYQNLEVGIFGESHADNLGVPNYTDQVQRGLIDFVNREKVEAGSAIEGSIKMITGAAEIAGGFFLIGSLIGTVFGVATMGLGASTLIEGWNKIWNGYPNAAHNIERINKGIKELSSYLGKNKLYYSPDEYVRVASSLIKINERPEELSKNLNRLLQQNVKKFGDSKEINNLINVLSNKFYPAFPSFTHFRKLSYDIGTGSKLQELLSERRSTKTEVKEPLNFYSKEISGRGLYDYLYFLLAFPYSFKGWDASEFDQIFFVTKEDKNHYTVKPSIKWLAYNESRAETNPKSDDVDYDTLLNIQTIEIRKWNQNTIGKLKEGKWLFYQKNILTEASVSTNFSISLRDIFKNNKTISFPFDNNNNIGEDFYKLFFEKNREQLKEDQQKKINYLLAVKAALLEQVIAANAEYFYKTPELRKYVESFSNASIFEIMDDSAYPDIDLPKIDSIFKQTKKMNPAFYYFNPTLNTNIADNKVIKVLKSSKDFKEKVREGIVASQPLNLNNRKIDERELLNKNQIISFSELSLDNLPTNGYPENQSKIVSEGDDESNEVKVNRNGVINSNNTSQIKTPRLKIDISSFNNENELNKYVKSFQSSITATRKEVENLPKMFGNKNFSKLETSLTESLKVNNPNGDVKNWLENLGKNLQIGENLEKYSSIDSLKELYEKSYADFFSTKGMQNAFPTFRLYIVEEDAMFSGKLTAYDDFYSYASVIGFDVNIDRELAASTAAIQLQNVSGILDGTKKEVLRDVDVDRREIDSKNDDKYEALIESIVLRPGINVQLRAGYENDTKDLDILISGRISDISHGSDGMTTNIIVQSYGVELEQQIKASTTSDKDKFDKYYTTHQLLGSLMLSPELKHFGRIKVGKIFQTGEDREISIDVKDYSNQSSFTLEYTTSFLSKLSENGHILALGVAVLPGVFKLGGKLVGKFGFTRSIAAAISRGANLTNQFFGKYSNFVLSTLSQAKYIKFLGKRLGVGTQRIVTGGKNVILPEVNAVLTNLKNGVELTEANLTTLARIREALGPQALKSINDLIGSSASAAIRNETQIMSYILRNEGMIFSGVRNYSFSALGNARTAMINLNNTYIMNTLAATAPRGILRGIGAWSSRAFSYTLNSTAVGLATIGSLSLIPLMIDTINNTWEAVKGAASDLYEELFESKKDDTLKIMLSPQDDNLFPPAPSTYLVSKKDRGPWPAISAHIKNFTKEYLNALAFNVPYMVSGYAGWESLKSEPYAEAKLKELKQLFDTRLVIEDSENEYVLKEQTIFKVFHEMSLRHPGYIYGARPYGRSMEYRMFFGLPNQNYWANDITTVDAIRLNQIIKDLTKNNFLLSAETCKSLYSGAWESFSKMNERRRFYNSYLDSSRANYGQKSRRVKERTDSTIKISNEQIRKIITKHAMDEYLEKTKNRFVPFRKMHSLNSDKNIVSNSVTVSSHDVINTVTVYYHDTFSNNAEGKYSLQMAANTAIKQNNVREKAVTNPRIIGPSNAYRYGIGELLYGARKLYTGSILVLGNTKINPWDVVILNDNVNRMHGPLEVKSVTHTFNHQTGFLTNVEINALVASGEDMLTYPAVTNSILAEAREKMYADYSSKIAFESANSDDKIYKKIIRKIVAQKFPRSRYGEDLTNELERFYIQKLDENIKAAAANDEPVFLQDIISGNATLPESLKRRIESISGTALTATIGLGLGEAGIAATFGRSPGITNLRSPIGWGFAALTGLFSALYLNSDSALRGVESSLKSGNLGKNLFRPILFSKISNQNLIEVYPIVKDGKPLLSGGFENIPADQTYKNVIGNIFSMVSDGYKGYLEAEAQIDAGGATSVLDWDDEDDFIEVKRGKAFEVFGKSKNAISKEIYHYGLKE
jgi:hypothetical protein